MSIPNCVACARPLTFELDGDEAEGSAGSFVPDDVELRCGCHYHWSCALENLSHASSACPFCGRICKAARASGDQQILCTVRNEGGVEEDHDLYPGLQEDAYLREHPKAHRAHAFLGLCETGDIEAITDLLSAHPSEEEDLEGPEVEVLRYQDPLRCMRSALHIAILAHQYTVAWLLLYFASSLEEYRLPSEVLLEASRLQVARDNGAEKVDIRALRDTDGRTAIDVAKEIGGAWDAWCLPDERGGFAAILASP